jgi:aspartyl-tRNA(Asn)/glutamyl-tRNA(Gln) amidotransferase subunit B
MQRGELHYFDRFSQPSSLVIQRIQMEQDSAKSFHDDPSVSYIDFNRAGMPLVEIVTEPEIYHPEDGKLAIKELQDLLKSLNISEANMDEGQMRVDVNVSLRRKNGGVQGERVEVKNVLGTRFIEKSIEFEIRRHAQLLAMGQEIPKETRRYDAAHDQTFLLRSKEEDIDYRFLVDPDIPMFRISKDRISKIKEEMPEVPFNKKLRLSEKYQLSISDVQTIFNHTETIPIFESLVTSIKAEPKDIFKWMYNNVYGNVSKKDLDFMSVLQNNFKQGVLLADLIDLIEVQKKLSASNGKSILYSIIDDKFDHDLSLQDIILEELGINIQE